MSFVKSWSIATFFYTQQQPNFPGPGTIAVALIVTWQTNRCWLYLDSYFIFFQVPNQSWQPWPIQRTGQRPQFSRANWKRYSWQRQSMPRRSSSHLGRLYPTHCKYRMDGRGKKKQCASGQMSFMATSFCIWRAKLALMPMIHSMHIKKGKSFLILKANL